MSTRRPRAGVRDSPMVSAKAGIAYGVIVSAIGRVLGTVRVLLLAPRLGPTIAVSAEVPIVPTITARDQSRLRIRGAEPAEQRLQQRSDPSQFFAVDCR